MNLEEIMTNNNKMKNRLYKTVVTSVVSASVLSAIVPMRVSGENLDKMEFEENEIEDLEKLLEHFDQEQMDMAKLIIEVDEAGLNELFLDTLVVHYNGDFEEAIDMYNRVLTAKAFPDFSVELIEKLIMLAEDSTNWVEESEQNIETDDTSESVDPETDDSNTADPDTDSAEEVVEDDSEEETDKETDVAEDKADSVDEESQTDDSIESDEKEEVHNEKSDGVEEVDDKVDADNKEDTEDNSISSFSTRAQVPSANSLYNSVVTAPNASAAWQNATEFKRAYPNDSRLSGAMNIAGERLLALGQADHRNGNYSRALTYYQQLKGESLLDGQTQKAVNNLIELATKRATISFAATYYQQTINASTATSAWNNAQTFLAIYPNDQRSITALEAAANRIFSMGRSSHGRQNYSSARQYYRLIRNESLLSNTWRNEAETYYNLSIEDENRVSANELYNRVLNAGSASGAWNAAQEFKETYPNDNRVTDAINDAAQRIYSMGISNHRRGNFNTANIYYNQLLRENLISPQLRSEVVDLSNLATKEILLRSANDYYNDSINASTATEAWMLATEGLARYSNDGRLVDALNTAAQRQFSLGQSQHRNGNYSLALTYYNRVLNHSGVRSNLRQVVSVFQRQAQQSKPIMTSVDYKNSSLRASSASSAWDIALEGLVAYPNNADIQTALNDAANRNLKLGRSLFRQGNMSSARTYFNRVLNEGRVSESIRTLAGVFSQQLTPNYKYTVYIDAGHGGRDPGASFGGVREKDLNLSTSLLLRNELESRGYNVVMSRDTDVFIEMSDRPFEANDLSADIFVSIHYNSMGGAGTARGIESFIYHRVASGFGQETNRNNFRVEDPRIDESLRLAEAMHSQLISNTTMRDRGVKGNNFNVLRNTHVPAMLTELAFLDNAADRAIAQSHQYQLTAARAMANGIDIYFGKR